jgi:hypothetical protein
VVELVGRVSNQLLAVLAAEMKRYRKAQQRGYAGRFESFNSTRNVLPGSLGGLVDVSVAGNAVAPTIWLVLKPILEDVNKAMKPFLELLGVSDDDRSPFCKTRIPPNLKSSLLNAFKEYMGKREIIEVQAADEQEDDGNAEAESQDRVNDPGQLNKEQAFYLMMCFRPRMMMIPVMMMHW